MICKPQKVAELFRRAQKIELILMDVDGVLTNAPIIYDSQQREIKIYHAHDGLGITLARFAGLKVGILSARDSDAIRHRALELKFDYIVLGEFRKLDAYRNLMSSIGFSDEQVCFVGDDLPDLPVLRQVGLPIAVSNATPPVKEEIPFHTRREGGKGAIREVVEFILQAQERLDDALAAVFRQD